jgi:hypothetical protein
MRCSAAHDAPVTLDQSAARSTCLRSTLLTISLSSRRWRMRNKKPSAWRSPASALFAPSEDEDGGEARAAMRSEAVTSD